MIACCSSSVLYKIGKRRERGIFESKKEFIHFYKKPAQKTSLASVFHDY